MVTAQSKFKPLPCMMGEEDLTKVRDMLSEAQATCCEGLILSSLLSEKQSVAEKKKGIKKQLDACKDASKLLSRDVEAMLHPTIAKRASEVLLL